MLRNRSLTARVRSVRSVSLIIHRKWLLHHQKVTRYSCNLNIGMEHKHTVQTHIRLLHLIRVCTIRYSAVLNKHKRKYGDDSILNIGPKYLSIHCVSKSYCSNLSGSLFFYSTFFKQFSYFTSNISFNSCTVSQYLALLWCVDHSKGETPQENLICILYCASYVELSQ